MQCAVHDEYSDADSETITCPEGQVISAIDFASYGTPKGSCGSYVYDSACHAPATMDIIQDTCVGLKSCEITAINSIFADPCYGTVKRLAVQVGYLCLPSNNFAWLPF